MITEFDINAVTAGAAQHARTDYPESARGAMPQADDCDALDAYRAFDDGSLAAVPFALSAYVDHHLRHWA